MALKKQWETLKENWLIIIIALIILALFNTGGDVLTTVTDFAPRMKAESLGAPAMADSYYRGSSGDFAPEADERLITRSASLTAEVESGTFEDAAADLKNAISSVDGYLLDENVYKRQSGWKEYRTGTYMIKVLTTEYPSVVAQLKEIGEVQSFTGSREDITERHQDLETRLSAERERLDRYQEMYTDAENVEDRIELSDRIFNQERTIRYLEDALQNVENQVSYSTIRMTIEEKQSEYAHIALVKFSELVTSFVDSVNTLLRLTVMILPYALLGGLVWYAVRRRD